MDAYENRGGGHGPQVLRRARYLTASGGARRAAMTLTDNQRNLAVYIPCVVIALH